MPIRACTTAAFTLVEYLVALVLLLILLSIFIPYLRSVREASHRAHCLRNIGAIHGALQKYASDNGQAYPRVIYDPAVRADGYALFTGASADDPFKPGGVEPSDVTASLYLLVRHGFVGVDVFVCPSSGDTIDPAKDPAKRSNFSGPSHLSYGYAVPFSSLPEYRFDADWLKSDFAIVADKGPGSEAGTVGRHDNLVALGRGNSPNHSQAGQYVLYLTGAEWQVTPYCGRDKDNIYTAQSQTPSTQPTVAKDSNGHTGRTLGPAGPGDSYLVPAADEH